MTFIPTLLTCRQDQTMIALLSGVVVVLIVCHTPKAVINIYESYQVTMYYAVIVIMSINAMLYYCITVLS